MIRPGTRKVAPLFALATSHQNTLALAAVTSLLHIIIVTNLVTSLVDDTVYSDYEKGDEEQNSPPIRCIDEGASTPASEEDCTHLKYTQVQRTGSPRRVFHK